MSNTDRFSMLERWADGMEKLEQYYEGIYGPPATPPSLPPITTYDAMLEAIADGLQRVKRNVNKKSSTYHSDSVAYVKTVPSGDVHYASLEQIGGRTLVMNQLVRNGNFADTSGWTIGNGITSISVSDNECNLVLKENATYNHYISRSNINFVENHKYYVSAEFYSTDITSAYVYASYGSNITGVISIGTNPLVAGIFTAPQTVSGGILFRFSDKNLATAGSGKIKNCMMFDLTLVYGVGNEPTTVQEFQQTFPASYYSYNAGQLLSAGVTSVVSKDANNTTLQTVSIPASVQALEGYGWSTQVYTNNVYSGDVYNQIDFENKKYIQNVGKVTLNGSTSWTWDTGNALAYTIIPNGFITNNTTQSNTYVMSSNPTIKSTSWAGRSSYTYTMGMYYGQTRIYCKSSNFTSANDVKTYFTNNPTDVNYVLQTPIETDISAYLTDDNLIEVEAGGTLTFPNQNGDDYRINVPSAETYMIDLQASLGS